MACKRPIKMQLTKIQSNFIYRHGIDVAKVFDATGLSKTEYGELMKEGGYVLAVGVTRCRKGNHSLRTRAGHCAICNPASIAFQSRQEISGDLYVLYSSSKRLVKVGVAGDAEERVVSANKQSYGNVDDWKLKFTVKVNNAGAKFKKPRQFIKDGQYVLAQEIFSCSIKHAIAAIKIRLE